eukprot:1618199-Amphidinium_carterae.2
MATQCVLSYNGYTMLHWLHNDTIATPCYNGYTMIHWVPPGCGMHPMCDVLQWLHNATLGAARVRATPKV